MFKKFKISQGEQFCGNWLRNHGLKPTPQYRIAPLPRFRYDYHFTYKGREYLFEFDGEQHFKFTPYFHRSKRVFLNKKRRDFLKTSVALMHGYYVIRIAWCDIDSIESIIQRALKGERLTLSSNKYLFLTQSKVPHSWVKKYAPHLENYLK